MERRQNLETPQEKVEIQEIWVVSWRSRFGDYSGDIRTETMAFTNKAKAEHFKDQIEKAFYFLRFKNEQRFIKIMQQ